MLLSRSLAVAATALVAFPAGAAAAGTRVVNVTVPMVCEGADASGLAYGFATRNELTLKATVPDTTAPGESIEVTDISGSFSGRYGIGVPWPDYSLELRDVAWVDIDAIGLSLRGATGSTLTVGGLPAQLPESPIATVYWNLWSYTVPFAGPLRTDTTTTAGDAPVVIDVAHLTVRRSLGKTAESRPVPTGAAETCRAYGSGSAVSPLAVIPSSAGALPAPVIESISPSFGPLNGGNVVTIKGDHFTYVRELLADGLVERDRPFVIKDDETIEYTVPTCTLCTFGSSYHLQVQSPFGKSLTSPANLYSRGGPPQPLPTITSVSPNRIPVPANNFQFTIQGTGLNRIDQLVKIAGSQNGLVQSVNASGTEAVVRVPLLGADHPLGAASVIVVGTGPCETARCESIDTPGDDITLYDATSAKPLPTITSIAPNRFPNTQGTIEFTLKGTGLSDIDELVLLPGFGQGLVQSVSTDGTQAVVKASIFDRDWSIGTANVVVVGKGPCVVTDCRSIDTPGDDLTFFAPTQPANFAVKGAVALKTLVKGSVPLAGTLKGVTPAAGTGAVSADLALDRATAQLTVLGLIPVTAQLAFVPTEKVTGTLAGTSLSLVAKMRIKIPRVSLFGIDIVSDANCQAKQVASVPLASTSPFTLAAGGSLAGTFAISNLVGCGGLTGIVSPLTAGKGNAMMIALTPTS